MKLNQVTLPATNIDESKRFYTRLGLRLIVDAPEYARFELPEGDATLSLSYRDHPIPEDEEGIHIYFECDNLDEKVAAFQADGIEFVDGPVDRRWLWREAWLKDPAGNLVCLFYAGENRKNPPWRNSES